MQVAVVGTGYVGLVTGTCLAHIGHNVVCVDIDQRKVDQLRQAKSPIFEPGLEQLLAQNIEDERLSFTTDIASALDGCEIAFIAVGTPEGEDGSADLTYVMTVARQIATAAMKEMLVVVKSTVPVGTCDLVEHEMQKILQDRKVAFGLIVASNPEFLKEGAAIDDFMRPDRIIVGLKDQRGREAFENLYKPYVLNDPARLFFVDRRSSELTKYGANAMLATRISFMNELARLCEKVGANIDHVRRGMGADPRIGKKFLYAGPGYGGSCFPKDVEALVRTGAKYDSPFTVLSAVSSANQTQIAHVSAMIKDHFKDCHGKKIAVWGLAFKPGTDDVRAAPALTIIKNLLSWGAEVVAHDPEARESFARAMGEQPKLSYASSAYEAVDRADAMVLVTEWAEYKRPNWDKIGPMMRQRAVFDFRNQYEANDLIGRNFFYRCVGRPDSVVKL